MMEVLAQEQYKFSAWKQNGMRQEFGITDSHQIGWCICNRQNVEHY